MKIYEIPNTSLKRRKSFWQQKKQQKLQPKNYEKYEFFKDDKHKRRRKSIRKLFFVDEKKFKYLV